MKHIFPGIPGIRGINFRHGFGYVFSEIAENIDVNFQKGADHHVKKDGSIYQEQRRRSDSRRSGVHGGEFPQQALHEAPQHREGIPNAGRAYGHHLSTRLFRTQKTLPRRTAGEFQFNCGLLPESYSREQLHIADYIVKYRQSVVSVYRAVRVGIAAALVERVAVGRVLEDSRGVVSVYNSVAVNVAVQNVFYDFYVGAVCLFNAV